MNLSPAITKLTPGWEILSQQIGLPFRVIDEAVINYFDYPVIILSSKNINKKEILEYISNGGSVITEADYAESVLDIRTRRLPIKYLYAKSDEIFNVELICDINSKCKIAESANYQANQDNQNCVLLKQIGKGKVIVFPSPFTSLLFDEKIIRKNFYSECGDIETNERVSAVSKGMIYHYVKNALEYLFHAKNLPFVNLWQFPNGEKNLFLFRVDSDFGSRQQIESLHKVCNHNNIKATWFVETKSYEEETFPLADFNDVEIGLHCYRHRNFLSYRKNYNNITQGKRALSKNGITPKGFAAPYGEWNRELNYAVEDCGFEYASEFGYAYDSFPMYPYVKKGFTKLLQIPIHPMSIGRLKWGGHNSEEIVKYFSTIIDEKISLQETIALYTHPGEENFDLWNILFEKINSLGIKNISFNDFADWWKERIFYKWEPVIENGEISIKHSTNNPSVYCRIYKPNGEVYLAPINDRNNKNQIGKAGLIKNYKVSLNSLRRKSFRMIRHDILSRYRKLKQ